MRNVFRVLAAIVGFTVDLAFLIAAVAVLSGPVRADTLIAAPPTGNTILQLADIIHAVIEWAIPIVGAVVFWLVGMAVNAFRRKTGIDLEAGHRDAIATWAENRAGEFLAAHDSIKNVSIDVHNPLIAQLAATAIRAVPDAIRALGLTDDDLRRRIIARIGVMTAASTMPTEVVTTVAPAPAKA